MSFTIARVITDSAEDEQARVKLKAPDVWPEESPLIPSVNAIPLNVDDYVYVDVSNVATPLILGRARTTEDNYPGSNAGNGSVLVLSKEGDSDYTEIDVKGKLFHITVGKTTIEIKDDKMTINGGSNNELVNIGPLKDMIGKICDQLQQLSMQLMTFTVVGNGAPLALPSTWFTPINTQKAKFEQDVADKNITH